MSRKDDDQLLVCVMDMEREARGAGRKLVQRSAQLLRPGLSPDASATPGERWTVLGSIPIRFQHVRHLPDLTAGGAHWRLRTPLATSMNSRTLPKLSSRSTARAIAAILRRVSKPCAPV